MAAAVAERAALAQMAFFTVADLFTMLGVGHEIVMRQTVVTVCVTFCVYTFSMIFAYLGMLWGAGAVFFVSETAAELVMVVAAHAMMAIIFLGIAVNVSGKRDHPVVSLLFSLAAKAIKLVYAVAKLWHYWPCLMD